VLDVVRLSRLPISAEDVDVLEQIEDESAAENVREAIGEGKLAPHGAFPLMGEFLK